MTVEQIELRRILCQMLADNNINSSTMKDMVESIISEKVEKAITTKLSNLSSNTINKTVKELCQKELQSQIVEKIRQTLNTTSISINCKEPQYIHEYEEFLKWKRMKAANQNDHEVLKGLKL